MLSKTEYESICAKVTHLVQHQEISHPTEDIFQIMRLLGLGKMESIKMTHQIFQIDISEAKNLVHGSLTWSDRYVIDEQLHQSIEDILQSSEDAKQQP